MIRRSRVVIVICPSLEDTVRGDRSRAQVVLIENAPGLGGRRRRRRRRPRRPRSARARRDDAARPLHRARSRRTRGSICSSTRWPSSARPAGRAAVLAGGKPDQVRRRAAGAGAGIDDGHVFAGERPAAEIPAYLLAADVLVSPRSRGTNTPLKIYQYLRSGKPIVATRLLTHTQVLSDETAILTGATPRGIRATVSSPALDRPRARRAHRAARTGARRDEIQLRGLSRTDARAPARRCCRGRRCAGAGRRRVKDARVTRATSRDHYSYTVYADPATARTFDERRFGGPIGELVAGDAGARARQACRPRRRADRSSTSAPARAAPRCCWRARRRARHRRRRVGGDARRRAAAGAPRRASAIAF